jgi:hypothetical protein
MPSELGVTPCLCGHGGCVAGHHDRRRRLGRREPSRLVGPQRLAGVCGVDPVGFLPLAAWNVPLRPRRGPCGVGRAPLAPRHRVRTAPPPPGAALGQGRRGVQLLLPCLLYTRAPAAGTGRAIVATTLPSPLFLRVPSPAQTFLYAARKPTLWLKVWFVAVRALTRGKPLLYSFQGALPHLPVPPIQDTVRREGAASRVEQPLSPCLTPHPCCCCTRLLASAAPLQVRRYLESAKPLQTPEEFAATQAAAAEFLAKEGPTLQWYLRLKVRGQLEDVAV